MLKNNCMTALLLVTTFSTPIAFAASNDDYLSANGLKVELGQSQRYLESKLGVPNEETADYTIWTLKNGNRLAASFDEYGLSDATISGSKPDFLYSDGIKITIGQDNLNTAQKKHTHGCYYQSWGEGLIGEYVVRSGPEGSWNLTFRSFGTDDEKTLKTKKIESISMGYEEPYTEATYCTY